MHKTTKIDLDIMGKDIRTQVVVNPNLKSDGLIGLDILTDREHKSSYLTQTRSKTKGKRRIETRLSSTTSNESCESRESSPTPPSDTDNKDRDSTSTVNSDEEESARDSELPNNAQYQHVRSARVDGRLLYDSQGEENSYPSAEEAREATPCLQMGCHNPTRWWSRANEEGPRGRSISAYH